MRDPHLSKPVQERPGQAFTPSSLCKRVLTAEDLSFLVLDLKTYAQLGDVDFSSVVEASIQTLEH